MRGETALNCLIKYLPNRGGPDALELINSVVVSFEVELNSLSEYFNPFFLQNDSISDFDGLTEDVSFGEGKTGPVCKASEA